MVEEKMINTSFGVAASHGERAPGNDATHTRILGAWTAPMR